jgi:hypothetical protein
MLKNVDETFRKNVESSVFSQKNVDKTEVEERQKNVDFFPEKCCIILRKC